MFCKYCGNAIEPTDSTCPKCGRITMLDGGNGFWDMASAPDNTPPQKQGSLSSDLNYNQLPSNDCNKRNNSFSLLMSIVSCAFCVICIAFTAYLRQSSIDRMQIFVNDLLYKSEQQKEDLQSVLDDVSRRIDSAEKRIHDLENPPKTVIRTSTPSSAVKPLGYVSSFDENNVEWLFDYSIEGAALFFVWEKRADNGTWQPLVFDEFDQRTGNHDIDPRYGIAKVENLNDGYSRIVAVGLTDESFGVYQCTVFSVRGTDSIQVELTLENESDNDGSSTPPHVNPDEQSMLSGEEAQSFQG